MIRGTTPTHIFTLPFGTSMLQTVRVIYSQQGAEVLVKTGDELTLAGNTVSLKLTQEETLRFKHNVFVDIQLRVLTLGGDALASGVFSVPVSRLLEDEVLT